MTTNTTPGVVAHALHALAAHIEAHQLPTPAEIQVEPDQVEIHLSGVDALAWTNSLGGADKYDVDDGHEGRVLWHTVQGRLPDTGVRVQFQWVTLAGRPAVA